MANPLIYKNAFQLSSKGFALSLENYATARGTFSCFDPTNTLWQLRIRKIHTRVNPAGIRTLWSLAD